MKTEGRMPNYGDLEEALSHVECLVATSEGHGVLCGLLCSSDDPRPEVWLNQVVEDAPASENPNDAMALLGDLYAATLAQLVEGAFDFYPLLPDDEDEFEYRVEALGNWCAGFLAGLGLGDLKSDKQFPPEVVEVLRDFMEITKLQIEPGDSEDDERSFAEVVEYVRMGVILVFEYLQGQHHAVTLH